MNKSIRGNQSGFTITKLLMISAVVGVVALLGMKVAPEYIEYFKVKTIVKAVGDDANAKPNVTVGEVRSMFAKHAEIDHIKGVEPTDLDITKEGNRIEVSFAYTRIVHLFSNISIMIEFEGSSAK